jgi:hypothetical protein
MKRVGSTCRNCGAEVELDIAATRAGCWRFCPACRRPTDEHRCTDCGQPLRLTSRILCARCLGAVL